LRGNNSAWEEAPQLISPCNLQLKREQLLLITLQRGRVAMNCRTVIWGSVATLGVILIAAGITLTQIGDGIVEDLVHQKLSLTDETSDGYKYFITPPVPVKANFTFFEVTNPDDVTSGGVPNLRERGPYVFTEHREKRNINRTGTSIKYGQHKYYTFLKELSCSDCEETDTVNIINMPLLGLIGKLGRMRGITGAGALGKIFTAAQNEFEGMGFEGIVMTVSVRDFLFDGIKTGSSGWMIGLKPNEEQGSVLYITDRLPITVFDPVNGFALFNHKNDTMENEWYEVETELSSWEKHTMITKWGQQKKLNEETSENNMLTDLFGARSYQWGDGKNGDQFWGGLADVDGNKSGNNTCNILKGTDGNQFPPGVQKENPQWIFNPAPCRSIFVEHTQEVDIEDIPTLEFAVPQDGANINKSINVCACESLADYNLANGNNNDGSCIKRTPSDSDTLDLSTCPPEVTAGCTDGIQDLYHCQGAATTLSYPHFYLAESQTKYFTGLNPDPEKHRLYLNVEPRTGMTLKLHSRIQLNVPLINAETLKWHESSFNKFEDTIPFLANVPDIPNFPVVWIDLGADVESDPDLVDKLISELVRPVLILEIGQYVAIGVGAALVVAALFFAVNFYCLSSF